MLRTRRATMSDMTEVMELEKEFSSDLFFISEEKDVSECLDSGYSIIYTSADTGKIVAFILISVTEYRTAYIEKVFVHPSMRGHSLQQHLVTGAINVSKPIACYTMVSLNNNISLHNFKKCGFTERCRTDYKNEPRIILAYEVDN